MKILHIGLSTSFTENMTYQDNLLTKQNILDGHKVMYITNNSVYCNGILKEVNQCTETLEDGMILMRLKYKRIINNFISNKIRKVVSLLPIIEDFKPDIIMLHSIASISCLDVIEYIKKNDNVKLFADSHTSEDNSGRNILSKYILHRVFYKRIAQRLIPYLEKYFYIGYKEKEFSIVNYDIPENIMDYLPLGGIVFEDCEYYEKRKAVRNAYNISDNQILLVHTGKFNERKKTADLVKAFYNNKKLNAKLIIAGVFDNNYWEEVEKYLKEDSRILYINWIKDNELLDLLCAADMYCQPGSVSATMQNAICCRTPILSYPHITYQELDYGQFVWAKDYNEIYKALLEINEEIIDLKNLSEKSYKCGKQLLDYRIIAKKIY